MTSQRFLALLFTDIVGSTERAVELRDEAWQDLRRQHDAVVRKELRRFSGTEVNTAGDSFIATFDEPEQAIRCAAAIQDGLRNLGLEIRSGVHVGKVEGEGRQVAGLAVHVGARVAAEAGAGEILVTEAVREALAGSRLDFDDRGTRPLKGLPGEWRLFAVRGESLRLPAVTRAAAPARWRGFGRGRRMPRAFVTLALGFLLGLGVLFAWRSSQQPAEAGGRKVLAVLPFENVGAAEDEYFADGMTDEVRGKLAGLPGLQVIASQSSAEYKNTSKSLPEIARELGADYLVVGKVRWEKGEGGQSRVRVSPELVEITSGRAPSTKWQAPFDAAMTNVFRVQADIAARVASELDVALGTEQREALAAAPTGSLAAYDAYLKGEGTQAMNTGIIADLRPAIGFYEQAVALDPRFVPAWAQLARAHALYYFNGAPSSAGAARAKEAAERAVALAPDRPESHLAVGDYQNLIRNDATQALAAYAAGLKVAPSDPLLLGGIGVVEQTLGHWEDALQHFSRALALDPRSLSIARRHARALLWLRRYPESSASWERALALAPADAGAIQGRAMVQVAQGDLTGARKVLRSVAEVETQGLVAYMGNIWDLGWVLDEEHQRVLLGLGPDAFGDDRGTWAVVLAQVYAFRGDDARARSYADSARTVIEEQLRDTPDDPQRHAFLGLSLAYLGRKADAIREGERAVALAPIAKDGFTGPYLQHQLVRIYILVGEPEKALDRLEPLLALPYYLSPGWLRIDPTFDPLRGNPHFERLAARA